MQGLSYRVSVLGPVLASFNPVCKKWLEVGGAAGDAVVAAADCKVLDAGSGL